MGTEVATINDMLTYSFLPASFLLVTFSSTLVFAQVPAIPTVDPPLVGGPPATVTLPERTSVAAPSTVIEQRTEPSLPSVLEDEGQSVPPGYHRDTRVRWRVFTAGAIAFGVPYGISALFAVDPGNYNQQDRWLLLPLAGPIIDRATSPRCPDLAEDDTAGGCYVGRAFMTISAGTQIIGAALMAAAFLFPERRFLRNNTKVSATTASWAIAPMRLGQGAWGVGAAGTF